MISRAHLVFIVFYITAILIAAVGLRTSSSRYFNRFRAAYVAQNRLKQQLWQKQLQLENLTNPDAISRKLKEQHPGSEKK